MDWMLILELATMAAGTWFILAWANDIVLWFLEKKEASRCLAGASRGRAASAGRPRCRRDKASGGSGVATTYHAERDYTSSASSGGACGGMAAVHRETEEWLGLTCLF